MLRLFHAFGGSRHWFGQRALPALSCWRTLVLRLPDRPCLTDRPALLPIVLRHAAQVAEQFRPGERDLPWMFPELRLRCAHKAVLALLWELLQSAAPALPAMRDPWGEAAAALVRRSIWAPRSIHGRWWAIDGHWALLWPLAGRDLATERGMAATPAEVIQGLAGAAYLPAGPGGAVPAAVRGYRQDGRLIWVLPVAPALPQRCGLNPAILPSASLTAAPVAEPECPA